MGAPADGPPDGPTARRPARTARLRHGGSGGAPAGGAAPPDGPCDRPAAQPTGHRPSRWTAAEATGRIATAAWERLLAEAVPGGEADAALGVLRAALAGGGRAAVPGGDVARLARALAVGFRRPGPAGTAAAEGLTVLLREFGSDGGHRPRAGG